MALAGSATPGVKVLLIEDDVEVAEVLSQSLRREGHKVVVAHDGEQGLRLWAAERPDLVLLDGALPKMDGFEVCRRIRAAAPTPVILLTGRRGEAEIVEGLRSGADDYVTKPFGTRELLARMTAVLRRTREQAARGAERLVRWGDHVLDPEAHEVRRVDRPLAVSRLQFRLLHVLAANAGHVLPYTRLIDYVWGEYDEAKIPLVKSHIAELRKVLDLPREGPGVLEVVPGVGYRLTRPATALAS